MDCGKLKDNMDRYLDRELSVEMSAAVEHHLAQCPACRGEYGALVGFLSADVRVQVPEGLRERVLAAVVKGSAEAGRPHAGRARWMLWPAAAAAVVLVALGWWLLPADRDEIVATAPQIAAPLSPWLAGSLVQNWVTSGPTGPLATMTQAVLLERLAAQPLGEPPTLAFVRHRSRMPSAAGPQVSLPAVNVAVFSSFLRF